MSILTTLYPGDRVASSIVLIAMTVSITAAAALLISRLCRRRPAVAHAILISALICIFSNPLIAILFRTCGTSTFAWSLLPPENNGHSRPGNLDGDRSLPRSDGASDSWRNTANCRQPEGRVWVVERNEVLA